MLGLLGPSSVLSVSCSSVWASRSRARRRCCSVAAWPWIGLPRGRACVSASAKLVERAGVACAAAALRGNPLLDGLLLPSTSARGRQPGTGAGCGGQRARAPRAPSGQGVPPWPVRDVQERSPAYSLEYCGSCGRRCLVPGRLPCWATDLVRPGTVRGLCLSGDAGDRGLLAGSVLVVSLQNWCPC
jgi:hypothetical protein